MFVIMQKIFIIPVLCLLLVLVAWFFRWETVPVSNGGGFGGAYMVNRWTGGAYLLHGMQKSPVKPVAEN